MFTTEGDYASGISAAGTTQATATTLPADHCAVSTVAQGAGVIMKAGNKSDLRTVTNNASAASLLIYPPVGASINGATANAPLTLPANRGAIFRFIDALNISAFF